MIGYPDSTFELRRRLLTGGTSAALLVPLAGAGLLTPTRVLAAEWNRSAFTARSADDALKAWGSTNAMASRDIVIVAPEIAENGAKVEVEATCNLPNVKSIAFLAEKNPMPLCAVLDFTPPMLPYARIQIKLSETTRLRVVARTADGRSHVALRDIKVTLGGCGG